MYGMCYSVCGMIYIYAVIVCYGILYCMCYPTCGSVYIKGCCDHLLQGKVWYVLSCLWDGIYKNMQCSLSAVTQWDGVYTMVDHGMADAGFFCYCVYGSLPSVTKKTFLSSILQYSRELYCAAFNSSLIFTCHRMFRATKFDLRAKNNGIPVCT